MILYDTLPAATRIMRAIRDLGGPGKGGVLGYYPVARLNPYQSLMYSRAWDYGFAPVGLFDLDDLDALQTATLSGTTTVLHLHWTSNVIAQAASPVYAEEAAARFLKRLERLKTSGIRIVWTVHNVLPHMCRFPREEIALRERLIELADRVHVMTSSTPVETGRYYALPADRIMEVPHPSYVDAYPRHHAPRVSKFELGYSGSDLVVGMVGSIQPYKGIDLLVEASGRARQTIPRLQVLVAGLPGSDPQSVSVLATLDEAVHVRSIPRQLDPNELSLVTTALSAMVLPYRGSLNSGAALLALSFGIPIIAPRIGHFRELISAGLGLGYDEDDASGLTSALVALPAFLENFDPEAALDYCDAHTGRKMSQRFFEILVDAFTSSGRYVAPSR